jgi:RNA polymerase sigma-70 factor (ECF subfamily)
MSIQQATTGDFHADLKTILPRLRVYALSLTGEPDRADDLVQRTVVKALVGRKSFQSGTNFPGWLFRIQRNEFISGLRSLRPTVPLDDAIASRLSHEPRQESGIVMREFKKAFRVLSSCQRETLLLAVLEGYSYDRIAAHSGVSVGTVKSRVSRARTTLRQILTDEGGNARRPTSSDAGVFARHLQHRADGPAAVPQD